MNPSDLPARVQALLDVALNHHLGLVFDRHETHTAHAHFDMGPQHLAFGGLHGGALYVLLDAVCLLALLPALAPGQHAVTHDLHISMMRPVAAGAHCQLTARVIKLGRSLAFLEASATVNGQVVASARITKSLITMSQ